MMSIQIAGSKFLSLSLNFQLLNLFTMIDSDDFAMLFDTKTVISKFFITKIKLGNAPNQRQLYRLVVHLLQVGTHFWSEPRLFIRDDNTSHTFFSVNPVQTL